LVRVPARKSVLDLAEGPRVLVEDDREDARVRERLGGFRAGAGAADDGDGVTGSRELALVHGVGSPVKSGGTYHRPAAGRRIQIPGSRDVPAMSSLDAGTWILAAPPIASIRADRRSPCRC